MEEKYVYFCPKCKTIFCYDKNRARPCGDCKTLTVFTGFEEREWYSCPREKREELKKQLCTENWKDLKLKREKEQQQNEMQCKQKSKYALTAQGKYEYDVVTVLNVEHGRIDADKMKSILSDYANSGWRLHSVYSNELGKNVLAVMGVGANETVCEDVLIFERPVVCDSATNYDSNEIMSDGNYATYQKEIKEHRK